MFTFPFFSLKTRDTFLSACFLKRSLSSSMQWGYATNLLMRNSIAPSIEQHRTQCVWNLISRNTFDLVSPPRRKHFEIRPLSIDQVQQLLAAARGHRLEALFMLALASGSRRGRRIVLME